tara:strand:- start:520 stop:915 length:396 start_codon:yes stop_codon:yes gene_type:complete
MYSFKRIKIIEAPSSTIIHSIKKSDKEFSSFGELYFSQIKKNQIRGWKRHKKMYCNLSVPHGKVKFVIKLEDKFKEFEISNSSPALLTIFPNTFFAFKGLEDLNVISNLASLEHDSKESENIPLKEINYEW